MLQRQHCILLSQLTPRYALAPVENVSLPARNSASSCSRLNPSSRAASAGVGGMSQRAAASAPLTLYTILCGFGRVAIW